MVWSSSAQSNRPYAPPTLQTVCKLVTPSSQNVVFCSFSFQSLAHSFAGAYSTTPLPSYSSALFAQNTGGGYIPPNLPFVFKSFRTLTPSQFLFSRHSSFATNSFICHRSEKHTRNSFSCHTSKNTRLKALHLPHIQKLAGVGVIVYSLLAPSFFLRAIIGTAALPLSPGRAPRRSS